MMHAVFAFGVALLCRGCGATSAVAIGIGLITFVVTLWVGEMDAPGGADF